MEEELKRSESDTSALTSIEVTVQEEKFLARTWPRDSGGQWRQVTVDHAETWIRTHGFAAATDNFATMAAMVSKLVEDNANLVRLYRADTAPQGGFNYAPESQRFGFAWRQSWEDRDQAMESMAAERKSENGKWGNTVFFKDEKPHENGMWEE